MEAGIEGAQPHAKDPQEQVRTPLFEPLEGMWPCGHLAFRLRASRSVRK